MSLNGPAPKAKDYAATEYEELLREQAAKQETRAEEVYEPQEEEFFRMITEGGEERIAEAAGEASARGAMATEGIAQKGTDLSLAKGGGVGGGGQIEAIVGAPVARGRVTAAGAALAPSTEAAREIAGRFRYAGQGLDLDAAVTGGAAKVAGAETSGLIAERQRELEKQLGLSTAVGEVAGTATGLAQQDRLFSDTDKKTGKSTGNFSAFERN